MIDDENGSTSSEGEWMCMCSWASDLACGVGCVYGEGSTEIKEKRKNTVNKKYEIWG